MRPVAYGIRSFTVMAISKLLLHRLHGSREDRQSGCKPDQRLKLKRQNLPLYNCMLCLQILPDIHTLVTSGFKSFKILARTSEDISPSKQNHDTYVLENTFEANYCLLN